MKTIQSLLFYFVVLSCTSFNPSFAQTLRLASYSSDGSYENLYLNHQTNEFKYSSLANPTPIVLTTLQVQIFDGSQGKIYKVQFPNDPAAVYTLHTQGSFLESTSPSGEKQLFGPENKYVSKNPNGIEEYIFASGPPPSYRYASSNKPKPIPLASVGGDMMQGYTDVTFPGETQQYRIAFLPDGKTLTVTDPKGVVQIFEEATD